MRQALQEGFNCAFTDNGNSFTSCFQFVEASVDGQPHRRLKVYNKFLSLL
jgi:hypothetical protein